MKITLLSFFILLVLNGFSQPDPAMFYPGRITEITTKLKTLDKDTAAYNKLLWERVGMQVSLIISKKRLGYKDTSSQQIISDLNYLISGDVKIASGFLPETKLDFLYTRANYYLAVNNSANALADYFELLKYDTDKRFRLATLYRISLTYFEMKNIDSALVYVDQILEENKNKPFDNSIFSCDLPSSVINWKIEILQQSHREQELRHLYEELVSENRRSGWEDNATCFSERLNDLKEKK